MELQISCWCTKLGLNSQKHVSSTSLEKIQEKFLYKQRQLSDSFFLLNSMDFSDSYTTTHFLIAICHYMTCNTMHLDINLSIDMVWIFIWPIFLNGKFTFTLTKSNLFTGTKLPIFGSYWLQIFEQEIRYSSQLLHHLCLHLNDNKSVGAAKTSLMEFMFIWNFPFGIECPCI